jgi:hypothetical protein
MAEERLDLGAAASALYGGKGLDDYDNTPPEANDFPSPFGRGADDGLAAGDNRQAGPRRQDARPDGREPGQPKDYAFGRKPVEYDFTALEEDGAHAEDVAVFKEAAQGLGGDQAQKLADAHRQISENFWARQESEGHAELQAEFGGDLDNAATQVNDLLKQFDHGNELASMLARYRMTANPAVFRFLYNVAMNRPVQRLGQPRQPGRREFDRGGRHV